jgi:hypothetical protein
MLINKAFTTGDVVSLKLSNGDEVIARFEEENNESIKIKKPLAVTIGPQGLGMMPWMFLASSEVFTLNKNHVYVVSLAKKEAASQYMQGTTGITIA